MTAVLVALAPRLNSEVLIEDVERLAAAGQDVHLVSWVAPSVELQARLGEVVVLGHKPAVTTEDAEAEDVDADAVEDGAEQDALQQDALEQAVEPLPVGDVLPAPKVEEALLHPRREGSEHPSEGARQPSAGAADTRGAAEPQSGEPQEARHRDGDGPDGTPRQDPASGLQRALVVASRAARSPRPYAHRAYKLSRRRARLARRFLKVKRRRARARVQRPLATASFFTDERARRLASSADVLVAVDSAAVLAVWSVVRRRADTLGVIGTANALARLRDGDPGPA